MSLDGFSVFGDSVEIIPQLISSPNSESLIINEIKQSFSDDEQLTVWSGFGVPALVPTEIYNPSKNADYLKLQNSESVSNEILIDSIGDYKCLFSIPTSAQSILNLIPNTKVIHHETTLFYNFLREQNCSDAIFIAQNENYFDIMIICKNKLQVINRYPFNNSDDTIYYIMYAMKLYKMQAPSIYLLNFIKTDQKLSDFLKNQNINAITL